MAATRSGGERVRALVPEAGRSIIAARAPDAEVVAVDDRDDLDGFEFLVPIPRHQAEIAEAIGDLPDLRVVQTLSAGVEKLADVVPEWVTLCSARGARDSAVAEWCLGALLGASSRVLRGARARSWTSGEGLDDLSESSVLILGMGSIGESLRVTLRGLGTEVVGVVSRARDGLHGVAELPALLPEADAVVVLLPLSDSTLGLIDADAMARMRDGALLINAGRGPVLDIDALVRETSGASPRLRAVLDVTDPEPLPDGHPLWSAPGVLSITPHIAGNSPRANRQAAELAGDQLARFCAGEPLHNVVHPATAAKAAEESA